MMQYTSVMLLMMILIIPPKEREKNDMNTTLLPLQKWDRPSQINIQHVGIAYNIYTGQSHLGWGDENKKSCIEDAGYITTRRQGLH